MAGASPSVRKQRFLPISKLPYKATATRAPSSTNTTVAPDSNFNFHTSLTAVSESTAQGSAIASLAHRHLLGPEPLDLPHMIHTFSVGNQLGHQRLILNGYSGI